MTMSITKEFTFDAAHYLSIGDDKLNSALFGKWADIHGHTYKLEVSAYHIEGALLAGMIMNFAELKNLVDKVISRVDHTLLNDVLPVLPTLENMTNYFHRLISAELEKISPFIKIKRIRLYETTTYCEIENELK